MCNFSEKAPMNNSSSNTRALDRAQKGIRLQLHEYFPILEFSPVLPAPESL
jgi:hypothetical protein